MAFKAGAIFGEASLNTNKWMAGLSGMKKSTVLAMGAITAVMVLATAKTAKAANEFTKELTNVNTLLDENVVAIGDVQKALLGIDSELGETTKLTNAMYQAFSAGAETLDEALKITTTSAKFAKAGVTDITTSVDVLTTAVNAYGSEIVDVEQASDIFFTTIKRGKITGDQLASSIGNSIPLFASAGIALEELASGMAAMTKQGVNGAVSTTQLNAIINGFLKPSEAMVTSLQAIGFESGSAFLKAEGLAGALKLIETNSEGDAQKISELLPNIRAMRGAMALTGVGGKEFTATLKEMETAAGATQIAFDKQEKTWETLQNSMKKVSINVGLVTKEFVDKLAVGLTTITEAFNNMSQTGKDFIGNFLTVGSVIGTVTLAVVGLNAAFVALAANPVTAIIIGVTLLTTGVIALSKSLNDKAIRDAAPRFEEIAESLENAAVSAEELAEISISLDRFFQANNDRNPYGNMFDESVGITKQVTEMAKRFEITEQEVIKVALASENLSEEQTTILETLSEELIVAEQLATSFRIAKELNSGSAIFEEKSLMRAQEKVNAQNAINTALDEQQAIQDEQEAEANRRVLKEQSRLKGVIEARKTALASYNKSLETAEIRANLGITTGTELLEESSIAAKTYRDDLIAIGFDGADASTVGNRALTKTISLLTTQEGILEDIGIEELGLVKTNNIVKDSTTDTIEELTVTWKDYFKNIQSGFSQLSSSLFSLLGQSNKNRQAELELETQAEQQILQDKLDNQIITQAEFDTQMEELDTQQKEKMNELQKKQFAADKLNRISGIAQNTISSIMGWWEVAPTLGPVAGPIFAGAMTGLLGGLGIANAAAVAGEQFVPALATGGTGSGPTRINESGGEIVNLPDGSLVIPNDISRQIANDSGGGTVINVSFAGAKISDNMDLNKIVDQVSRKLGKQLRTA